MNEDIKTLQEVDELLEDNFLAQLLDIDIVAIADNILGWKIYKKVADLNWRYIGIHTFHLDLLMEEK